MSLKALVRCSPLLMSVVAPLYRHYLSAMSARPILGPIPSFSGERRFGRYASKAAFDAAGGLASVVADDRQTEIAAGREAFRTPGHCALCQAETTFLVTSNFSPGQPNWRETTFCESCGLTARMRFAFHVLLQEFGLDHAKDNYIAEAFSKSYRWLKGRYPRLTGSEFLSAKYPPGKIEKGVRHEDLQNLSFADASLDTVLHFEVLEHVPFLPLATAEMARVLRPGGRLFFTAPFRLDCAETITLASMEPDGTITDHVLPREIHGNPADPAGGAICFRHFGWDYLDELRAAGFRDLEVISGWSDRLGYCGLTAVVTGVKA